VSLSVASNGITNAMIAPGAVTPDKVSTTGAGAGQVLKYNGSEVVWGSDLAGGLTVPFNGDSSVGSHTLGITNTGDGYAIRSESANNSAIYGYTASTNDQHSALWGKNKGNGPGVTGSAFGSNNVGVFGAGSTNGHGVYGMGHSGYGVFGDSTSNAGVAALNKTTGNWAKAASLTEGLNVAAYTGHGVIAYSATGDGVSATAQDGVGVYGSSPITGIYGASVGFGVKGYSLAGTGGAGASSGVYGETNSTYGWDAGVKGISTANAAGVHANSTSGDGVASFSNGEYKSGIYGVANGNGGYGGYFVATAGDGTGLYAQGGSSGLAARFQGNVSVLSGRVTTPVLEITGGSDLSEQFKVKGIKEHSSPNPGMVVSIDPESPCSLTVSDGPYDRKVAGVISGAGGINPGVVMGQSGTEADGASPVALTGRVYCQVDASYGRVEPGDLLTTSATPGHAMKVTDYSKAQGATIGKAMTSLKEGKGLVLVLVTLQ
jgi:hypothetical protein